MNWQREAYELSDDTTRLQSDAVCALLNPTYWAAGRTREQIEKSMQHSFCLGLFHAGIQVGFARAVTDYSTFTYLCDVIVAPAHRGRGLGKWMVEILVGHPELQTSTQCLRTRDAHSLYERHGFERTEYLRRSQGDWSKRPV